MNKKGFTLVEILVVVGIIGLLVAIVVPSLTGGTSKARDARRQAEVKELAGAIELYKRDNGTYPDSAATAGCSGASQIWSSWSPCWQNTFTSGVLPAVPVDPQNIDKSGCGGKPDCRLYSYCVSADRYTYAIGANLENAPQAAQSNPSATVAALPGCNMTSGSNLFWIGN